MHTDNHGQGAYGCTVCAGMRKRKVEEMSEKCTVCHAAVSVCDSHHDRALDPNAPAWSESTTCEGRRLRDALAEVERLTRENADARTLLARRVEAFRLNDANEEIATLRAEVERLTRERDVARADHEKVAAAFQQAHGCHYSWHTEERFQRARAEKAEAEVAALKAGLEADERRHAVTYERLTAEVTRLRAIEAAAVRLRDAKKVNCWAEWAALEAALAPAETKGDG
jgi:chromosome segregation ATPase